MRAYKKGLIILSAVFIFPTCALAADTDTLDVTMTVIESPQESPDRITNRIEVPTEEYLQARERNQRRDRLQRMDGDRDMDGARDHENMEGSREMMQEMMQGQQQEMMQDQQQDMQMQQEMMQQQQQDMQMQQQEIMQQQQDMQDGSGGQMGSGTPGMGM